MKNTFHVTLLALLVIIPAESVLSQIESGDKELSVSASFMSRKAENADEAWTSFIVAIRMGFFVTPNIEIEPEILFSDYKESDAGYIISGNLAYNFNPIDDQKKTVPFIFAGFGFSNTLAYLPNIAYIGQEDGSRTLINAGGGFKTFLASSVSLRIEYRYQNFMNDQNVVYHNVLLGISAFL